MKIEALIAELQNVARETPGCEVHIVTLTERGRPTTHKIDKVVGRVAVLGCVIRTEKEGD